MSTPNRFPRGVFVIAAVVVIAIAALLLTNGSPASAPAPSRAPTDPAPAAASDREKAPHRREVVLRPEIAEQRGDSRVAFRPLAALGAKGAGATAPAIRIDENALQIDGPLAREAFMKQARAHAQELRECGRRAPDGQVATVELVVKADGGVEAKGLTGGDERSAELEACVVESARAWRFPSVEGGVASVVRIGIRYGAM